METAEPEQPVAWVDVENNSCKSKESQVENNVTSIEPPNCDNKQTDETEKTKETETPKSNGNENADLDSTLDWIPNEEVNESLDLRNDEKENLLHNINTSFVDALCEAEVEKNLTELEDKVKNMLEELEKSSNDTTENLVVELDLNDINNLREELDDLSSTNDEYTAETQPEAEGNESNEQCKENVEENTTEVDCDSNKSGDIENTESGPNESVESTFASTIETNENVTINQNESENTEAVENVEVRSSPPTASEIENSESEPSNEQSDEANEINPNISILESTLINGKETESSTSKTDTTTNSITENMPVIKSEKSDTIDNCDNNSLEHNMSNDIDKQPVVNTATVMVEKEGAQQTTSTTTKSIEIQPATPDLIVREFCLQQDSLCNLVSATIESSLTVDTAQKEDQETSLVQHLLLSEPGITSFKVIEDIFKDVKNLSSTEYLLLYSKLNLVCTDINPSVLATAFDMKRRTKITENPKLNEKIQNITKGMLNRSSIDEVEKILKKMEAVNPNELLFLHTALPKGYKGIKDTLRITTICCRPIVSQTIMWLKTHYEEYAGVLTCKPDVFKGYQIFCEKNQIKPCGIPDFGKIIKRIFTKIFHRRQVVRGKTQYFYCGLRRRYQLPNPKLPSLSSKSEIKEIPYSSSGCCAVYVYMHNLKYRQLSMKDYLTSTTHEPTPKKQRPPKDPDFYKKGDFVNGKSILVHDPLELLSLSMNDNSQASTNDHVYVSRKEKAETRKEPAKVTTPVKEYKNTKPSSRSKGRILKTKFKQYRHPSIKNIMNTFKEVIVPYDLYNTNVNPVVKLNNKELYNWCAANIERFIDQISNINIVKNSDSSKLKVKYECCDKTLKVNQYYGEQLRDLKRELGNLEIAKYVGTNDYCVTYVYPAEQLPDLLQLNDRYKKKSLKKTLSRQSSKSVSKAANKMNRSKITSIFSAIKNKHTTIEKLLEKVDNITLPEEIITRNIEPQVSLDSSEVTDWFEEKLNILKYQAANPEVDQINVEENEVDLNSLCETEFSVLDGTVTTHENNLPATTENINLNVNRKRPLISVDEDEPLPLHKKTFHLSDIINGSGHKKTVIENKECKITELTCYFCLREFQNEKELQNHCDIHLRCRTCKRRLPNQKAMIDHLVKHCFMNNAKCAPNLILPRIDQVSLILNKYPGAFDPSYTPPINTSNQNTSIRFKTSINRFPHSVLKFNNVNHSIEQILPAASTNENISNNRKGKTLQTYSKSQKSANFVRFTKPNTGEVSHYQITTNPFKNMNEVQNLQQSTSHLKSTISNNFNRIFLLSNNTSAPQPESSNVVYGLYLNNRTDRSSPICLNNYNRIGSDCALNTNPSCSLSESTNFMQIVETPNTSVPQPTYESTIMPENNLRSFEHQDHSYFQQPVYQLNNDVSTLNNGLLNGVPQQNLHSNSMYDMSYLNTINTETQPCVSSLVSTENKVESTNTSSTVPGQFRIRVKDIRELS